MRPSGLALNHPSAETLLSYATSGCPTQTGQNLSREQIEAAIERGPHVSVLVAEAMEQLQKEVSVKVQQGQAKVIMWDDIKHNFPPELKISPIAMIPHKSQAFRAIIDLSFALRLANGGDVPSINSTTTKAAPAGGIDQLGHSLWHMIHAFAQADADSKIFMAKWDIKDGFWRLDCAFAKADADSKIFMAKWDIKDGFWWLDCQQGQEWNFAYV